MYWSPRKRKGEKVLKKFLRPTSSTESEDRLTVGSVGGHDIAVRNNLFAVILNLTSSTRFPRYGRDKAARNCIRAKLRENTLSWRRACDDNRLSAQLSWGKNKIEQRRAPTAAIIILQREHWNLLASFRKPAPSAILLLATSNVRIILRIEYYTKRRVNEGIDCNVNGEERCQVSQEKIAGEISLGFPCYLNAGKQETVHVLI